MSPLRDAVKVGGVDVRVDPVAQVGDPPLPPGAVLEPEPLRHLGDNVVNLGFGSVQAARVKVPLEDLAFSDDAAGFARVQGPVEADHVVVGRGQSVEGVVAASFGKHSLETKGDSR